MSWTGKSEGFCPVVFHLHLARTNTHADEACMSRAEAAPAGLLGSNSTPQRPLSPLGIRKGVYVYVYVCVCSCVCHCLACVVHACVLSSVRSTIHHEPPADM